MSPRRRTAPDFHPAFAAALPPWVVARLLVVLGMVTGAALYEGSETDPLRQGLWAWDGAFYRDIAEHGYQAVALEGLRFFPLYPLLGRVLGMAGDRTDLALLVVSNVSALALGVLIYQLAWREKHDRALAGRAAWLIALVPPAFVLVFAYAEATYLLLAVATFVALRDKRWWWVAVFAALAAFTRPHGLFLMAPIAIEAARGLRSVRVGDLVPRAAALLGPVVGVGIYLGWVESEYEDGLLPLTVQGDFRGDAIDPFSRVVEGFRELFVSDTFGDGLHLPFVLAVVALVVLTFRYWPASYGAYAALVVVAALTSDNLNSFERYALDAFPIILTIASLTAAERAERITLAVCGGGLVALTAVAYVGLYVP